MLKLAFPGYRQISKRAARARFDAGRPFAICPCDLRPGFPFAPEYIFTGPTELDHWRDHAAYHAPTTDAPAGGSCWAGSIEQTAWDLMFNNWAFYNLGPGMGRYARFYDLTD